MLFFKDNKSVKKRDCLLRKVEFKNKKGFVSGERFCGSSDAIEISIESSGCSNKNQMLTFLTIGRKKTLMIVAGGFYSLGFILICLASQAEFIYAGRSVLLLQSRVYI